MRIEELFQYFDLNDIRIFVQDNKLKINAPKDQMNDSLKQLIIDNKTSIMEIMSFYSNYEDIVFKRDTEDSIPTYAQERLWKLQYHNPNHLRYFNTIESYQITGLIDKEALKISVQKVIDRHEVFRSRFIYQDNKLTVKLAKENTFIYREESLCASGIEQEQELKDLACKEIIEPFDLENGPLIKIVLVRKTGGGYVLLIVTSRIIVDGWSASLFSKELKEYYNSVVAGNKTQIYDLPTQYYDYSLWQRKKDCVKLKRDEIEYWKEELQDTALSLYFPKDFEKDAPKNFVGQKKYFVIGAAQVEGLDRIRAANMMSMYMVMIGVFQLLFYRYTENEKFAIFTPMLNRNSKIAQEQIGLYDNLLIYSNKINPEDTVTAFLQHTRDKCLSMFDHQEVPFEVVVKEIIQVPKFEIQLSMLDNSMRTLELENLQVERHDYDMKTAMCDFEIYFWMMEDEIQGYVQYLIDSYSSDTIDGFLQDLSYVIQQMFQNPNQQVNNIKVEHHSIPKQVDEKKEEGLQPVSNNEKAIASICCELLSVSEVDMEKTFIELGGHSLLCLKYIDKLQEEFHLDTQLFQLYNSTLKQIAELI